MAHPHSDVLFHRHPLRLDEADGTGDCRTEHDEVTAVRCAPSQKAMGHSVDAKPQPDCRTAAQKLTGGKGADDLGFVLINLSRDMSCESHA